MKPFIRKCRRCKTWEVNYIDPDPDSYGSYYIDGFKSWRDAMDYALAELRRAAA